jgi:hypothetical protein
MDGLSKSLECAIRLTMTQRIAPRNTLTVARHCDAGHPRSSPLSAPLAGMNLSNCRDLFRQRPGLQALDSLTFRTLGRITVFFEMTTTVPSRQTMSCVRLECIAWNGGLRLRRHGTRASRGYTLGLALGVSDRSLQFLSMFFISFEPMYLLRLFHLPFLCSARAICCDSHFALSHFSGALLAWSSGIYLSAAGSNRGGAAPARLSMSKHPE